MTTYTIAYTTDTGMLLAVVPDGQDIHAAAKSVIDDFCDPELGEPDYTTHEGLILTDDPEKGDKIIYSGNRIMGWLSDENDKTFDYAVLR